MHSFLGRSTPCIVKIYPCPNSIGDRANKKFVKKRKKKWYKLSHKKRKQLGSQSHTIVLRKHNKTLLFYNTLLIKYDGGYRSDLTWRIHNNCEYIYILFYYYIKSTLFWHNRRFVVLRRNYLHTAPDYISQ